MQRRWTDRHTWWWCERWRTEATCPYDMPHECFGLDVVGSPYICHNVCNTECAATVQKELASVDATTEPKVLLAIALHEWLHASYPTNVSPVIKAIREVRQAVDNRHVSEG